MSNYILIEKFTEDRKAETWKKEIEERLVGLDVEINQVVSDLCGAIRSCTKALKAEHIPELFHAQYEISKAVSAPLAIQVKCAEKALSEAEEDTKKLINTPRRLEPEKRNKQLAELEEAISRRDRLRLEAEEKIKRRETSKIAVKEMSKIHHPIDLKNGKLQTASDMEKKFGEQFKLIKKNVKEARLNESNIERLDKAKRAFDSIVSYLRYFFVMHITFVRNLHLKIDQELFFNEVVFPLSYLKMIWRRLPKKDKEEIMVLMNDLMSKARDGPWPEKVKQDWLRKGKELAETFQRSSSCVEGRNGVLSLNHHRFHRLGSRSLKVLTIVHNYGVRRPDGSTAAERFFEAKHADLFESLVRSVRIPERPKSSLLAGKKRLVA